MRKTALVLAALLAVAGICVMLWPVFTGHRLQSSATTAVQEFLADRDEPEQQYLELLADLQAYVACCGTSIQPVLERLRQNPKLDTVYLCLDNDEAGEDACDGMLDTLEDMGYDVERLRPEGKDWNDDLRAKRGGHG